MKTIILYASAVVILFMSSCKKDDSSTGVSSTVKIKTYTEDITSDATGHQAETYNITYDDQNRLVSMISTTNAGNKFLYQYNGTESFSFDIYGNNVLSIHEDLFLNSLKLVDSTIQYNETHDTSTEKYTYNSAKQLVKMTNYDFTTAGGAVFYNATNYTYDGNGNTLTEVDQFSSTVYTYDQPLLNLGNITPPYLPVSKSLPSKSVTSIGGTEYTVVHTYTFDSEKRLTTDKAVGSEGSILIKTYTY